ncbi:MAG: response regulator [Alphaproteobacteria bacterium]|jgi:signal transduction histidine kinase/CheY-like chemotaxis protein|nr:response regulator [Alphaproteobacteria bacterium]
MTRQRWRRALSGIVVAAAAVTLGLGLLFGVIRGQLAGQIGGPDDDTLALVAQLEVDLWRLVAAAQRYSMAAPDATPGLIRERIDALYSRVAAAETDDARAFFTAVARYQQVVASLRTYLGEAEQLVGGDVPRDTALAIARAGFALQPLVADFATEATFLAGQQRLAARARILRRLEIFAFGFLLLVVTAAASAVAIWRLYRQTEQKRHALDLATGELRAARDRAESATAAISSSEAEARRASEQLDDALSALGDGFVLYDAADRVVIYNRRFIELFPSTEPILRRGTSLAEILDTALANEIVTGTGQAKADWRASLEQYHATPVAGGLVEELRDGRFVFIRKHKTATGGTVGLYTDFTEIVRQREALALAKEQAELASRAKSDFLAVVSHELRTPLNGIIGMGEVIGATYLTAEQRRWLTLMRRSADQLLTLVDEILDLARIEAGKLAIEPEVFDPAESLRAVVDLLTPRAEERDNVMTFDADPSVPAWVRTDERRFRQILLNLVGNAIKFTEGGRIDVTLRASNVGPDLVELRAAVTDTGIGVSPAVQARMFDSFAQGDASTSRRHGGSGLGLAIARRLARLLGGDVGFEQPDGRGSRFWFTALAQAAAPPELPSPPAKAVPGRSLAVLVAEDNAINREVLESLLAAWKHRATTVVSGEAAVNAAASGAYDVVLMDIQMPGIDGVEATRAIRALPGAAGRVPVIAVTANVLPEAQAAYRAAGMAAVVTKPVRPQALADALAAACPD